MASSKLGGCSLRLEGTQIISSSTLSAGATDYYRKIRFSLRRVTSRTRLHVRVIDHYKYSIALDRRQPRNTL